MRHRTGYLLLFTLLFLASCKKYKDTPGNASDPRLNRPYCNDPEAVNYNWDFPGKPDNSVCLYPADVFTGRYTYTDSLYGGNENFIREEVRDLTITASSRTKLAVGGFCAAGNALSFTASRRQRAEGDTLIAGNGQPACRPQDTLSGAITRPDINGALIFDLRVATDTGVVFHRGSAVKK